MMEHRCKRCGIRTDFFIESYCPLEEKRITTWLCADCIFDANILLERFVGKEE